MKRINFVAATMCLGIGLTCQNSAQAQISDTLQHRLLWSSLNDSTLFKFFLGPVVWKHSGTRCYLRMGDSISLPNGYLRTIQITPSSGDTLAWNRWAGFDDVNWLKPVDIPNKEFLDSVRAFRSAYYANREFHPNSSYFGSTSSIRYIVEIRDATNDAVLWAGDTLKVYVNANGYLRYRNYPSHLNLWGKNLSAYANMPIYLAVRQETSLPFGASLAHRGEQGNNGGYVPYLTHFRVNTYQEGYPGASQKPVEERPDIQGIKSVNVRVIGSGQIQVFLESVETGTATIKLSDELGRDLLSIDKSFGVGSNTWILPGEYATGSYFCTVNTYKGQSTHKITVVR